MSYYLSSLELWQLIVLIVALPTAAAIGAQLLIRQWVGVDKLAKNNEIAGFKFATVGSHLCGAAGLHGHRRLGKVQ